MVVKVHSLFARQYENVKKIMCLPEYFKDASIEENYMHMQRKKIMFQEMASSIRLSLNEATAASTHQTASELCCVALV
jgi:hypothetical protein